jgi:hypothetical protein
MAHPDGLSTPEIIAEVYHGAREPDFAATVIHVAIWRMRKQIRRRGLVIEIRTVGVRHHGGFRYQLRFT